MKIGILGGTFNPIHLGHIELAKGVFTRLKLDKLIFIPAFIPPHKSNQNLISWEDRYKMVELAIKDEENFEVSDIERRFEKTSYSINTIKEFKSIYGGSNEVYFIAGSDYVNELKSWKDIDDLKRLCTFIIVTRPGYNIASQPKGTEVINLDTPNISSTDIRRRIKDKRDFRTLVPEKAYDYIVERKLYL